MVNLGGGFPAKYVRKTPRLESYGKAIFRALRRHFGNAIPETIVEPGREQCLANCRARPWEPHKYASKAQQDEKLAFLLDWVAAYYERDERGMPQQWLALMRNSIAELGARFNTNRMLIEYVEGLYLPAHRDLLGQLQTA